MRAYSDEQADGRAIQRIVQRANAKTVTVKRRRGTPKRMSSAEFLIEQTFADAMEGDVKAHKTIVAWSKRYLLPVEKRYFPQSKRHIITQQDVDVWAADGAVPRHCVPILEKMSLADLNKSYRAYLRNHPRKWPDGSIRSLRSWFGNFLREWNETPAARRPGRRR